MLPVRQLQPADAQDSEEAGAQAVHGQHGDRGSAQVEGGREVAAHEQHRQDQHGRVPSAI